MTTEEEDEEELLMPMAHLFSKMTFLTKRLTHGRATNHVRLQVWDAIADHRLTEVVRSSVYFRINPEGVE